MASNKIPNYLLLEKTTFIYMVVLSALILFFHTNLPHWLSLLGFNLCICLFMFVVASQLGHKTSGWWHFFRHFYPLLFFIALYEENRYLIHMVFPDLFDHLVNRLELAVFGSYPTVWMQKFISFGFSEYMMFAYICYYFLLLVLGLGLFRSNKIKQLDDLYFTITVTFFISFLGFIFFPVAGPRFALADLHQRELGGGLISHFVQNFMYSAGIHGAAMPSSHVAVALVVLVYAKRHHRILCAFSIGIQFIRCHSLRSFSLCIRRIRRILNRGTRHMDMRQNHNKAASFFPRSGSQRRIFA